jgi:polysaccharide deacetylase family protein (PEP-CTERM system associated)
MLQPGQGISTKPLHILTVSVEEYFHAGAFTKTLQRKHWGRLEGRLDEPIDNILNQLRRFDQKATFFVLGCIAAECPDLVAKIMADGHEIGSSTYWPRSLKGMMPDEFREDVARATEALKNAGVSSISGFRASRDWMRKEDLWILDELADMGYAYDSSLNPIGWHFFGQPERYQIYSHQTPSGKTIHEFPVATIGCFGFRVGIAGGNWIRQFPHTVLRRLVSIRQHRCDTPLVFYFMPWELDRHQPKLSGLSKTTQIRHYRNLGKTSWVFEHYLRLFKFTSIGNYIGLPPQQYIKPIPITSIEEVEVHSGKRRTAVSLVIPLFNEEQNIGYLKRTLIDLRKRLSDQFEISFVLVDDGSADTTWQALNEQFGTITNCELVQQPKNMGVAAAILAGIDHAETEIVCSLDCDCSYDPYELARMIPLIEKAELVTASPYHPDGCVLNVPSWRLLLSKTLSRMYSFILKKRLHTFTSCCRVYRKSAVMGLQINDKRFLGVAETLIRMHQNGVRIVEHPATLESRVLGESKMKVIHTIKAHLVFLTKLARERIRVQ